MLQLLHTQLQFDFLALNLEVDKSLTLNITVKQTIVPRSRMTFDLFEQPVRGEEFPLQVQRSLALRQRLHPLQRQLASQTLGIFTAVTQETHGCQSSVEHQVTAGDTG